MTVRLNGQTLPDGWVWSTLSKLCRINYRNPELRNLPDDLEVTFLPMAAVDAITGTITQPEIRELGTVRKGFTPFTNNDVLFAKITPSMENGKATIATDLINGVGFGSTEFHVLSPKEHISPKWIFYYIRQSSFRADAKANFSGTAGQLRVPTDFLTDYPIPHPPLNEQRRIVEAIETQFTRLDAAVTALKRSQANLKRYRAAVLKAACEGRLVSTEAALAQAEGRSYEPASVLLEQILDERRRKWEAENPKKKYQEPVAPDTSGLPELPEGWCWATIDQATVNLDHMRVPVNKEERAERSGDIPYYGANGPVGWIDDYIFDEPLILVVEDETFTGREKPFCYKISGKSWVNNHAHVLRAKAVTTEYLNYSLSYYPFTPLTTGTTGRRKLTKNALLNASYAVPPMAEQQRIVAEVERRLSLIDQLEKTIKTDLARANRLRQSILKRAFAGQLVPQNPNDEPASMLLERIRAAKDGKSVQPLLSTVKE